MHFHCFKTFGTIYGGGLGCPCVPVTSTSVNASDQHCELEMRDEQKKKTQAHKKQWKTWERSGTVTANSTIHCGLFSDPNMNQTEKESGLRRKMPWVSRKTAKQMRKAWQIRGNENGFTISVTSLWCSLMPLCSSCLSKKPLTAFSNIQNTSQRSMYQVKSGSQVHASLKCAADVRRFDSLLLSSRFETFYTCYYHLCLIWENSPVFLNKNASMQRASFHDIFITVWWRQPIMASLYSWWTLAFELSCSSSNA